MEIKIQGRKKKKRGKNTLEKQALGFSFYTEKEDYDNDQMESFKRGIFQRKKINEYGEQKGKSKQNDLDLTMDLY